MIEQFIPQYLELHSSPVIENRSTYQLGGISSISFIDSNQSAISIGLTSEDLNHVKNLTVLATSLENTFISQVRGAVTDPAGNQATAVDALQPLQVYIYTHRHMIDLYTPLPEDFYIIKTHLWLIYIYISLGTDRVGRAMALPTLICITLL